MPLYSPGGGSPGGSNTQVQINNGGVFGGDAGLTFDPATDALTVGAKVAVASGASGGYYIGSTAIVYSADAGYIDFYANGATARLEASGGGGAFLLASTSSLAWTNGTASTGTKDLRLSRAAANIMRLFDGTNGASIEFDEMTEPAAPADGEVRLYAKDAGGGKTGLYARFASGAVQQVALEP